MAALTILRLARKFPGLTSPEYPHLETLIEQESVKIKDGYHYARWITPLAGVFLAVACFLPLALTVHPLFWIGTVGLSVVGGVLGWIFHVLAMRISPTQLLLRKRCMTLGQRLITVRNLLGMLPTLSPKVAAFLEEAASIYLAVRPPVEPARGGNVWTEASLKAHRAMDDAMAQMLALAEPETPQAQEVELARGWAQPLLEEMKATAHALVQHSRRESIAAQVDSPISPLAGLADARADLERLETAVAELEHERLREGA